MAKIELLLPQGERAGSGAHQSRVLAPRLQGLEGATVGIFSNSWQCMTYLGDEFREQLRASYGVKEVIRYDSPTTAALSPQMLQEAAARCDAAIVGLGT
jgi:hypothetical protein